MFETAWCMLIAAIVPLFRLPGPLGHSEAKENLLLLAAGIGFAALCFTGIPAPGLSGTLLLVFVGYMTLTCLWCDAPQAAIRELPRWWAGVAVFLLASQALHTLVLAALFLPAIAHVAYGMVHQYLRRDPLHPDIDRYLREHPKALRFYGWLGNTNYNGAFFVPLFFVGLHLMVTSSPWWILVELPVLAGIVVTRCRAAWISVVAGFVVFPETWPVLIVGAVAIFFIGIRRPEPILGRWFYARFAWLIWRKRPVFGWGPRVFRRKIFRAQADANQKDRTLLGDPAHPGRIPDPKGEWAHNEYLDFLMEGGIVGLGLFLAFAASVLGWSGRGIPDIPFDRVFLVAGFVAMLVNAALFYNLRLAATAMPFWVLAGILASDGPAALIVPPLYVAIPAAGVSLYLVYHFAVKSAVAQVLSFQSMRSQDKDVQFQKALQATKWAPKHNVFLTNLAFLLQFRDPAAGMNAMDALTQHFDGEKAEWAVWDQYGRMATANRAYLLGRSAFMTAIYLNPSYRPAWEGLKICEDVLAQIGEEIRKAQQRVKPPTTQDLKRYGKAR